MGDESYSPLPTGPNGLTDQLGEEGSDGDVGKDDSEAFAQRRGATNGTSQSVGGSKSFREPKRPLAFVEDYEFQSSIGALISFNVLIMAGETDSPDFLVWWYLENVFLLVFCVELLLRVLNRGLAHFFASSEDVSPVGNVFDAFLVALGVCELWLMPMYAHFVVDDPSGLYEDNAAAPSHSDSTLVRTLRLLRLLRLIRVIRIFPSLLKMVEALNSMLQTFAVIFAILGFFILTCAIVCTQLLGQGGALDHNAENFEQLFFLIQMNFRDVMTSVFTLFQITTTDNWMQIAEPVIKLDKRWMIFFVFFILIASWTMISVLTAVASDCMVMATNNRQQDEARKAEEQKKAFLSFLKDAFYESDADGNGLLDKDEFDEMIQNPKTHEQIRNLNVNINMNDMEEAWKMLDVDGGGELTIDEFVTGLQYLHEGLSTKHIVDVEYAVKRVSLKTEKRIEKIKKFMEDMKTLNEEVYASLQAQEIADNQQIEALWCWKRWVTKHQPQFFVRHADIARRLNPPRDLTTNPIVPYRRRSIIEIKERPLGSSERSEPDPGLPIEETEPPVKDGNIFTAVA